MNTKSLLIAIAAIALQGCESLGGGTSSPPMVCAPSISCPALECPPQKVITRRVEVPVEIEVPATRHMTGNKEMMVMGAREYVTLLELDLTLEARVDTGAETSSLHALDITPFEREGKRWVRFRIPREPGSEEMLEFSQRVRRTVLIRQINAPDQRRYVISLWARIGDVREKLSFTLADRRGFDYPLLLGRNFLTDTAIVDVSRKHVLQ